MNRIFDAEPILMNQIFDEPILMNQLFADEHCLLNRVPLKNMVQ
jgi:hypothetical protein